MRIKKNVVARLKVEMWISNFLFLRTPKTLIWIIIVKDINKLKDINIVIGEKDKLVSPKKIDEMISMFGSAKLKKMEGFHEPFQKVIQNHHSSS